MKFEELSVEEQLRVTNDYEKFKQRDDFNCGKTICLDVREFWDNHKAIDYPILLMLGIITKLEQTFGKTVPLLEITETAQKEGLDKITAHDIIIGMLKQGDIFEPRRNLIQVLR